MSPAPIARATGRLAPPAAENARDPAVANAPSAAGRVGRARGAGAGVRGGWTGGHAGGQGHGERGGRAPGVRSEGARVDGRRQRPWAGPPEPEGGGAEG